MTQIPERLARVAFQYVQRAVNDGFPLKGRSGAIEEAARRYLKDNPAATLNRRSFRDRYVAAVQTLSGVSNPHLYFCTNTVRPDRIGEIGPVLRDGVLIDGWEGLTVLRDFGFEFGQEAA
jgi:hypothetical protein